MNTNDETICHAKSMQEYERKEILVVVKSDALVDPNAVMVKFFNAKATHATVL